jgi:hypothetical protein
MATIDVKDASGATVTVAKLADTGQQAKAGSLPVALASDDSLLVLVTAPTAGAITSVTSTTSDQTLLASNASRKGAYVYNDSTQVLYLALANVTASSTNFTQKMAAGDAFSLAPGSYTGAIKGLWASANGAVRVTEWS